MITMTSSVSRSSAHRRCALSSTHGPRGGAPPPPRGRPRASPSAVSVNFCSAVAAPPSLAGGVAAPSAVVLMPSAVAASVWLPMAASKRVWFTMPPISSTPNCSCCSSEKVTAVQEPMSFSLAGWTPCVIHHGGSAPGSAPGPVLASSVVAELASVVVFEEPASGVVEESPPPATSPACSVVAEAVDEFPEGVVDAFVSVYSSQHSLTPMLQSPFHK
mmetsp:Transcript_76141/g.198597  ORF Transcript_76141/g.198597 Transcript_76141/m.198597 type:complete len:217 (-) Transcript_76141:1646-2296(-)